MDLWSDNIICKIRCKINNRNVGILDSSIKLNESDCNVVIMKNIRKIVSYLQSVILLLIGITTAINIINCIYIKIQFVLLEENQLLYIYSSLAQVIGAILGLTIASYSMIDSKMKVYAENDDTVEEYI